MRHNKKLLKVKITKGPKIRDAKGVQQSFPYILKMVEDKWTISEAIELASVDRSAFYKHISEQQKNELQLAKTAHSIFGSILKIGTGSKQQQSSKAQTEIENLVAFNLNIEQCINIDWDF